MSPVEIKICGITRLEDALAAVELGAEMIGLNFYPLSPRCVTFDRAKQIADVVGDRAKLVGVFVNMNVSDVLAIARAIPLDAVQLHGDETPGDCETLEAEFEVIRALKVDANFSSQNAAEYSICHGLLLDTPSAGHGGSGEIFNWTSIEWESLRSVAPRAKLFLAGGLHPGNVADAIFIVHPCVVDVCSGVESTKGIKSVNRMRDFVAAVRAAERQEQ